MAAFASRIGGVALGATVALGLAAPAAQAGYIVTLEEVGGDVVATGSGTIDTADLNFIVSGLGNANLNPAIAAIQTGKTSGEGDLYTPFSPLPPIVGPTSFGSGTQTFATTGGGDQVGLQNGGGVSFIVVPKGYASGDFFTSTSTFAGETLSDLGVTPGKYVWTWGSGADADSFTLMAGAVPEPATWAMILFGFAGIGFAGYRASRKSSAAAV